MFETITFLTDFGLSDDFVGVCHGVIRRIARDAEIIDLTHGIAPQAVTQGALVLARAVPYLPVAVHLAVVDPGVGGSRRAIAVRTGDGRVFVGPDNGLLTVAADRHEITGARSLTNPRYHLDPVSRTFHARDLFAPVSAHLAAGASFDDLGDEVDPASLVRLVLSRAELIEGELHTKIVEIDRFGNLQLNATAAGLAELGVSPGDRVELRFATRAHNAFFAETFSDAAAAELVLFEDSYGSIAVAITGGSAAALTGARTGDTVRLRTS